jgi:DNA-binding NarL/FixJ family response regulator
MPSNRVVIVEDHPLLVDGLCATLSRAGYTPDAVSTVAGGEQALATPPLPAAAVVDLGLPDGSGRDLVARFVAQGVPVVVLTGQLTGSLAQLVLDRGALGVLDKTSPPAELVDALAKVRRGQRYLCSRAREVLGENEASPTLTRRELDVLALIAKGMSTKEIATHLGVAPRTVETHREHLHQKLGAHKAADLTREAIRRGLVEST